MYGHLLLNWMYILLDQKVWNVQQIPPDHTFHKTRHCFQESSKLKAEAQDTYPCDSVSNLVSLKVWANTLWDQSALKDQLIYESVKNIPQQDLQKFTPSFQKWIRSFAAAIESSRACDVLLISAACNRWVTVPSKQCPCEQVAPAHVLDHRRCWRASVVPNCQSDPSRASAEPKT